MHPEERLDAWGLCHELAVHIYQATRDWPAAEMHGLAAQARGAVFSAVVNLADEPLIQHRQVRRRRVGRALRALTALAYIFTLARELGYLTPDAWQSLDRLRHRTEELTRALLTLVNTPPRLLR